MIAVAAVAAIVWILDRHEATERATAGLNETPGAPDRGGRGIVTGGNPPEVYYYSEDHYRTFRRLEVTDGRR